MPEWTFLTNHALVFSLLARQPTITARELSATIGITERSVRKKIADLHACGYIEKKKQGRRIKYSVNPSLPLQHYTHWEDAIGDFIKALGCKQEGK